MVERRVDSIPEEEEEEEEEGDYFEEVAAFKKRNRRKIPLLEKITFERWDSLPDIWTSTMPKPKKGSGSGLLALRSASLSDLLEDEEVKEVKTNTKEKMSREHWQKAGLREKCNGCKQTISVLFKRHHCRMCGKIFCPNCSRYKRRLAADSKPSPDGDLHRVCLYCVKDDDDGAIGFTKSWTSDFLNMRQAAHARKFPFEKEPELKLLCEVPKICIPVSDLFLVDITKGNQINVKVKLQSAVKAARRRTECSTCERQLLNPKDRKECVFCGDIFCGKCSTKNLVVYYPRGAVQTEDIAEGKVQPTMDFLTGIDMSSIADVWRNYRACNECEKHAEHVLHVFHFNSRLQDYHYELMDLAAQIVTTLNRALQTNAEESSMNHSRSMEDLSKEGNMTRMQRSSTDVLGDVLSKYEEKMAEERVTQKLFDRYWTIYNTIRSYLKPVTQTQSLLHKHVIAASSSFYSEKRWHFRVRYDSTVSSASDD